MFGIKLISNKTLQTLREEVSLYQRTLDDIGWINLSQENSSQDYLLGEGFKKMLKLCKVYYYRNPLAGHWVNLTTSFVFGEGLAKPKAKNPAIQEVVNKFWEDPDNQMTLTSFTAQQKISNKIQYEGNLFFVLFTDEKGDVRVRVLNTADVEDIIFDPEDSMRPIFYKVRQRTSKYSFLNDAYDIVLGSKYSYYPDINNAQPKDFNIPADKLKEDAVIFHVKINCDINDKFGVPELYRGIDWIRAHKEMAEDVATLIKSLSKLAWKKKIKGTPAQVTTLHAAMNAKSDFTNRARAAGSTQYENEAIDTSPVNTPTGGAAIGEKGLKMMTLMVCAASGIFYHYFGDPETGNLATTTNMELPMIKKFLAYQRLWAAIYDAIFQYQVNKKIDVGLLPGGRDYEQKFNRANYITNMDRLIDQDFPPVIEKDPKVVAEALEIGKRNNLISDKTAARIFLTAEGQNNIEDELGEIDFSKAPPVPFGAVPAGGGAQPGNGQSAPGAHPAQPEEKPAKEAIEAPNKSAGVRFARKNNYVLQRMNGYQKSLAGNFMEFKKRVKESIKTAGAAGNIVGNVGRLQEHLFRLQEGMFRSAKTYFPIAVDIGKKYLQAHIKNVQETLFEANGKEKSLLNEKLQWNEEFVAGSLVPDIEQKIQEALRMPYETEEKFAKAIEDAVNSFDSRIEQYTGAFWTVEEAAVKEAGIGTGVMVEFGGADDAGTCDDCQRAMDGGPYLIDEAPVPGELQCNGRCRHALQVVEG